MNNLSPSEREEIRQQIERAAQAFKPTLEKALANGYRPYYTDFWGTKKEKECSQNDLDHMRLHEYLDMANWLLTIKKDFDPFAGIYTYDYEGMVFNVIKAVDEL